MALGGREGERAGAETYQPKMREDWNRDEAKRKSSDYWAMSACTFMVTMWSGSST